MRAVRMYGERIDDEEEPDRVDADLTVRMHLEYWIPRARLLLLVVGAYTSDGDASI